MRFIFSLLAILTLLLLPASPVMAQIPSSCRPIFGGGSSCEQTGPLTIDTKILNPLTNQYLDHAAVNELRYGADQTLVFRITVTNTGNKAIKDITVTDIFPQFVTYTKGGGEYDRNTNTLTYQIKNLESKQANTVSVEGKVATANTLAQAASPRCVVNQVTVSQGRNIGTDNAQFCLGEDQIPQAATGLAQTPARPPVLASPNIAVTPKTGPESIALLGLFPAAITGWLLRRKSLSK